MNTLLQKSFFTLLACLLALATLATPVIPNRAHAAPVPSGRTMPDGLMSALLEASAQPFTASANGYRAGLGGLDITVHAGGLQANGWGIALYGLGRGEQIAALPAAAIAQTGMGLECHRGAVTEWYRDTALGMEQGFTVHQAPRGAGPLVLQLDLSTTLDGAVDADGRGLFLQVGAQGLLAASPEKRAVTRAASCRTRCRADAHPRA